MKKDFRLSLRALSLGLMAFVSTVMWANPGDVLLEETFDTQEAFESWTIVDQNGGRTWEYLNGMAAYMLDYQTGLPGDDYYISPEFELDAGTVYELSFYMGVLSMTENLKVMLGTSTDPASFTQVLADYPSVVRGDSGDKTVKVYAATSGKYRLAFYAYSEPNQHRVEIDNVKLIEKSPAGVPGEVTAATLTPAAMGATQATLSFTAPVMTAAGDPLGQISAIDVFVNGATEPEVTYDNPAPGEALTYLDTEVENGFNTYRIVARNEAGEGSAVEVRAFVGLDMPVAPANALASLNNDMSITVTWDAPTQSVNGGYVDFDAVTYRVERVSESSGVLINGTSETTYTDNIPVTEGQVNASYIITPLYNGQEGEQASTNTVVTGKPLDLPYKASFAWGELENWTQDGEVNDFDFYATGDIYDDWTGEPLVEATDYDGGFLIAESMYADYGMQSRLVSPMINLNSVNVPTMKFMFHYGRSQWYDPEWDGEIDDNIQVQVSFDGGEWQDVENAQFFMNEMTDQWVECEVILPKNADANFANICLLASALSDQMGARRDMYVDNIRIGEASVERDLAVTAFTIDPKRVNVGENIEMKYDVQNRGSQDAGNYTINIYKDGALYQTATGQSLAAGATTTAVATYATTIEDADVEEITWQIEVVWEADEMTANNKSSIISTSVRPNELPAPEYLTATISGSNVVLMWDACQSVEPAQGEMEYVTDDFESYRPFAIDGVGDWTLYDGDGATTIVTPRIPVQYENQGAPMAYQVFNTTESMTWVEENMDNAFKPYSGEQYMVAPSAEYPYENDDWLITPCLDGRAQTIKFWAKAATFDSEWINVYVSSTDSHHDSFVKLNAEDRIYVGDGWREYSFDVPEGTRYFAVRCIRRCVMLMIDDFTFAPAITDEPVRTLVGYNIYCDGEMIATVPAGETTFVNEMTSTDASYYVTAVYAEGESLPSNVVNVEATAIEEVMATMPADARIYDIQGRQFNELQHGVNIIRYSNGTVRKVLVK